MRAGCENYLNRLSQYLVWEIHATRKHARLSRVAPTNSLCDGIGLPASDDPDAPASPNWVRGFG
jgi:hypothetical protein